MKYIEDNVQQNIVKYLRLRGILCTFTGGGCIHSYSAQRTANRLGYLSGTSDLICFLPEGKTLCIEVKRPPTYKFSQKTKKFVYADAGGKQSAEQKDFEEKVKKLGHYYIVAKSVSDVEEFLKSINL